MIPVENKIFAARYELYCDFYLRRWLIVELGRRRIRSREHDPRWKRRGKERKAVFVGEIKKKKKRNERV